LIARLARPAGIVTASMKSRGVLGWQNRERPQRSNCSSPVPLLQMRILVAILFGIGIAFLVEHPPMMVRLMFAPAPTALPVPVDGVAPRTLADTWGAARSGGRRHAGIDIFARRGTPVVSPVEGIVLEVGRNRLGGNVVKVLGPGLQVHYFAHLDRFAAIERGQHVAAGDVLGYVGDTGNARGTTPHLHYGLYTPGAGAVNPFPLLARRTPQRVPL
jgi:murein DD-endopeptidase MepM/ murein hydrolase activator NlpD